MARLPLYLGADAGHKRDNPNAGLLFERFFDQYNADASAILKPRPEEKEPTQGANFWLQKFKKAGNTDALQSAACRQMALVKQLNGKHKFFNTQWHFVTGTGYPHPVENGLLWHPVLGVPYLSGAAVKGLVRAWIEEWEYAAQEGESKDEEKKREDKKCKHLLSWFGSENKQSTANQTGDIIFFDALPVKEVQLVTDIMTPHYGKWYSEGGNIKDVAKEPEKVPADWHDPVPIPFLVVDKATSYLFSVAPRSALAAERVDMDCVICCLTNALEWLGAGAKTATGYGQMQFDPKTQGDMEKDCQQTQDEKAEALQKAQEDRDFENEIKNLSPLAQNYFTQIKQQDWQNKNAFWQAGRVEHWLDTLEKEPDPAIINSLKELMNKHFVGLLANPEKLQGKKKEPVYNLRQQQIARRVNRFC